MKLGIEFVSESEETPVNLFLTPSKSTPGGIDLRCSKASDTFANCLLTITPAGRMRRAYHVNPAFGFKLNDFGEVEFE